MSVRPGSNRINLLGTVLVFVLVGLIWHLMTRSMREQIQRAQRNGVTEGGATIAPIQVPMNNRITAQIQLRRAAEQGEWEPIERRLAEGEPGTAH